MTKTVLVVGNDFSVNRLFMRNGWRLVHSINHADLIQFTGGEDIDPSIYGHLKHYSTHFNPHRDQRELEYLFEGLLQKKPMAGVCRGGQLLNALNGGWLYQDVNNHIGPHDVLEIETGRNFQVNSIHHQMMSPSSDGKVLLVANKASKKSFYDKKTMSFITISETESYKDVECVVYEKTRHICYQPHPEYAKPGSPTEEYYLQLLSTYL